MTGTQSYAAGLVAAADAQAERQIGATRIAIGAILAATVFSLMPPMETWSEETRTSLLLAFSVIGLFLLLGLGTVALVQFGRYRPWMAWAFGLADITLVVTNLYLSTTTNDASRSVALATPGALLLCLLLVMQTLRYRTGLQLVLSVSLVVAVAVLVFVQAEPPTLESDRVFLSSLYGPTQNTARVVLIALIGALCCVAVWRANRLLVAVAEQSEARRNLTRFLPPELSEDMSDAALSDLRNGRTADLAIMFIDIRGFTAMSEAMGAAATSAFLTKFRSRITEAVDEHGGLVDKFIGDGALIVFGLRSSLSEAAKNAVRAGDTIFRSIAEWNDARAAAGSAAIRIVAIIHAGPVMSGAIGDERRLEFSVVGSTVNEASRIEAFAKENNLELVVSEPVVSAAGRGNAEWIDEGAHALRGSAKPVRLYSLPQCVASGSICKKNVKSHRLKPDL